MYDIHSHLLTGLDDGAESMEESLRLAQLAVDEGITHAVMTPHHRNGGYDNDRETVIKKTAELAEEIKQAGIPLTISPGQEVHMTEAFLKELEAGEYLSTDPDGKYYLVEFPWKGLGDYTIGYLEKMIATGKTPIIVHPERQRFFQEDPDLLQKMIDMGALAQMNTSSIIGAYTPEIEDAANTLVSRNLIHLIASDAHDTIRRPHNMQRAFNHISENYGKDYADYLFTNASKLFTGEEIKTFG